MLNEGYHDLRDMVPALRLLQYVRHPIPSPSSRALQRKSGLTRISGFDLFSATPTPPLTHSPTLPTLSQISSTVSLLYQPKTANTPSSHPQRATSVSSNTNAKDFSGTSPSWKTSSARSTEEKQLGRNGESPSTSPSALMPPTHNQVHHQTTRSVQTGSTRMGFLSFSWVRPRRVCRRVTR